MSHPIELGARATAGCGAAFRMLCGLLALVASLAFAEPPGPAQLEAFADSIIEPAMAASGVPGAIVTVVTRDRSLLAKGYGVADIESGRPVDPQRTLFNLASITKPMTAMATLRLARRGVVDLDADVNRYLAADPRGLRVTGPPVTLRELLVHHAGFDADLSHLFVDLGEDASMSAGEINRRLVLLREPGTVFGYDNQAYGLIGLVLAAVTGRGYAEVLDEEVFTPLGMDGAVYVLPDSARPELARCHVPLGPGQVKTCAYPVFREGLRGAGGVAASATDMGRFMQALLAEGRVEGQHGLVPELIADLSNFEHYRFHPALPGYGRGLTQMSVGQRPSFGHSGHVPGFSSQMRLFPTAGLGVLISFLGGQPPSFQATPTALVDYLLNYRRSDPAVTAAIYELEGFVDRFGETFVEPQPGVDTAAAGANAGAPALAGNYYPTGDLSRSLGIQLYRLGRRLRLDAPGPEQLRLNGQGPYEAVGPGLYQAESGHRLALRQTDGTTLLAAGLSVAMFERLNWTAAAPASLPLSLLALCLLLTAVLHLRPGAVPGARGSAGGVLVGLLLVLAGLYCELEYGAWLRIVQGQTLLPTLWLAALALGAALLVFGATRLLLAGPGGGHAALRVAGWVHRLLLAAAALTLVVVLWLWLV